VHDWDEPLIRDIFFEHDAEEILKIHIPKVHMNDKVAWFYEKNGIFTVRSAYRLAVQEIAQAQGLASTSISQDGG